MRLSSLLPGGLEILLSSVFSVLTTTGKCVHTHSHMEEKVHFAANKNGIIICHCPNCMCMGRLPNFSVSQSPHLWGWGQS